MYCPTQLPPAILIDLDDTIVMYSIVGDEVWEDLCAEFASHLDDVKADALFDAIGRTQRWF